jgi:outer membrane protein
MRILVIGLLLCSSAAIRAQQVFTLEQCLQLAEERNLAVLNAVLDAELAGHNRDQAYWDLAPDLNAVATHGYNYGQTVDRFTNTFANDRVRTNNIFVQSNVSLFEGLRKQHRIRQAGFDAESSQQAVEATMNDVRLEVVQAFLDVIGLRERIKANEAQVANTLEQIRRTEALVEGGRLARAELLTLRAQLAQEEFTLTDVRNQHDQRKLALGRAIQLDLKDMYTFDITAPAINAVRITEPTSSPDEVLENVLRVNPTYKRAELNVSSTEQGLSMARAGVLPSLTFSASAGSGYSGLTQRQVGEATPGPLQQVGITAGGEAVYVPTETASYETVPFGDQLDQNFNQSVGLTLSVPVFNNMRNRTSISQGRIRYEQSRNNMLSVRNDLQRSVLDALVMQRAAFRQFEAASKAVESGTLALEYAQERFAQGLITSIELSAAMTQLNRNQADQINAKYQYVMASKYLDILQGIPVTL